MVLGISAKKWTSIVFLLATIVISLALAGIPLLYEGFDGWQIPNKGAIEGESLSKPDVFPVQPNTNIVPKSSSTPVMPGVAISGDYKSQMSNGGPLKYMESTNATPTASNTKQKQSTSVFDSIFGLNNKEQFSTITSF
jgi:hypothetical protein